MVGPRRRASGVIDFELDRQTYARGAFDDGHVMDDKVAEFLARVGDFGAKAGRGDCADVADLAAELAVERRLIEDQRSALARVEFFDFDAVLDDRANDALGGLGLVTEKLGRAAGRLQLMDGFQSRLPPSRTRRGAHRRAGAPSRN